MRLQTLSWALNAIAFRVPLPDGIAVKKASSAATSLTPKHSHPGGRRNWRTVFELSPARAGTSSTTIDRLVSFLNEKSVTASSLTIRATVRPASGDLATAVDDQVK